MFFCPSRFRGVRWFVLVAVLCCAGTAVVYSRKGVDDFSSGMAAVNRGEFVEALESLQRLRRSHPSDDRTHLLSGAIRLRRGDASAALKDFASMQPEGEIRPSALLWTGECLYALGQLTEAESCFQQLLQIHRDSTEAHRWLAAIYHDLGELHRSVEHLERLTQLSPEDHRPWRMMGSIHRDFEQFVDAARDYREALKLLKPDSARQEIVIELADVLIRCHEYQEALDVLASSAETATTISLMGQCHRALGNGDLARQCLDRVKAVAANDVAVLRLNADLATDEKRPRDAAELYEQILALEPHNVECRYQLALARRELGDVSRYESEMTKVANSRGLLEELTALSARTMTQPRDAALLNEIAKVCDQLGKHDLAKSWRLAANAVAPESRREPNPSQ
ncbi:MAG: tetratricopeptide repeat protein [Planctomycetota bacterium]